MFRTISFGIFALGLAALAPPAFAQAVTEWTACDGQPAPRGDFQRFVLKLREDRTIGDGALFSPTSSGAEAVAACTQVLASAELEGHPGRRANLLKSRAVHLLTIGRIDEAAADAKALAESAENPQLARNLADNVRLTAKLLETNIGAERGDALAADRAAAEASALRPMSGSVQFAAILATAGTADLSEGRRLSFDRLVKLQPQAFLLRAVAREWAGDFAGASADWERIATWPDPQPEPVKLNDTAPPSLSIYEDRSIFFWRAAIAALRADKDEAAVRLRSAAIAEAEKRLVANEEHRKFVIERLRPDPGLVRKKDRPAQAQVAEIRTKRALDQLNALFAARKTAEDGLSSAYDLLVRTRRPNAPPALKPENLQGQPVLPALFDRTSPLGQMIAQQVLKRKSLRVAGSALLEQMLPVLGDKKIAPSAKSSDRLDQADVVVDDRLKDAKLIEARVAVTIENPRVAAQEMVLLRAAERARAANASGFLVLSNRNSEVLAYIPRNGTTDAFGYSTTLIILPVDPDALPSGLAMSKDQIWTVAEVEQALGPVYDPKNEPAAAVPGRTRKP